MEVTIKPCTHKQLARAMGVSTYVLTKWLQPLQHLIGKRKGYYYSLEQMLIIYNHIGLPSLTDAHGNAFNVKQQTEWQQQLQKSVR